MGDALKYFNFPAKEWGTKMESIGLARAELGRDWVRQELHGLARSQPTAQ